jgi:hypothetical protein
MATYYISTTGNDTTGVGSISNPWATWQKGFNEVVAGDTLYIRGGIYQPIGTFIHNPFGTDWYACAGANNKSGTLEQPIIVRNYPGERPILDGINNTAANNGGAGSRFGILMRRCSYWQMYGLEVTNVVQLSGELGVRAIQFYDYSHHNRLEQIVSHDNGGSGICFIYDCNDNDIVNCDSYNNYDHLSVPTPGNNADGIEIADITVTTYTNRINGCRCWDNSDDGIDLMRNEGIVIIDNTWCFINGVTADYQATGFKLGAASQVTATPHRIIRNCIAANNKNGGFVLNISSQICHLYNNIAVNNGWHGFTWYNGTTDIAASIIRNNISYNNYSYQYSYMEIPPIVFDHNNWDAYYDQTGPVITDNDFISVDYTEMLLQRKSDGSLPDIDYMHPKSTSSIIDAGIDVGLPYIGAAPDLGPFEYFEEEDILIPNLHLYKIAIL